LRILLHEELRSHILHIAISTQTVCLHSYLLYRNYYISYHRCAGLVQLQLIPQVHYINKVTSHNNNSPCHTYNLNTYRTELKMEWDLRQIQNADAYWYNNFNSLHVINSLLAKKWPPMLSERAVYTDMELC